MEKTNNIETNISRRFTYTAVNNIGEVINSNFPLKHETLFYKSMCEALVSGFRIIYAACISYNEEDQWSQVTVLKTYMSE